MRLAIAAALLLLACQRERRAFDGHAYREASWNIAEGGELYTAMNCGGCHAKGGGDIGPALMDSAWRYGSSPEAIISSILDGRPRGMPSFRTKLTEYDAAKIAAYVRSMSGLTRKDAIPPRDDHMQTRTQEPP